LKGVRSKEESKQLSQILNKLSSLVPNYCIFLYIKITKHVEGNFIIYKNDRIKDVRQKLSKTHNRKFSLKTQTLTRIYLKSRIFIFFIFILLKLLQIYGSHFIVFLVLNSKERIMCICIWISYISRMWL